MASPILSDVGLGEQRGVGSKGAAQCRPRLGSVRAREEKREEKRPVGKAV